MPPPPCEPNSSSSRATRSAADPVRTRAAGSADDARLHEQAAARQLVLRTDRRAIGAWPWPSEQLSGAFAGAPGSAAVIAANNPGSAEQPGRQRDARRPDAPGCRCHPPLARCPTGEPFMPRLVRPLLAVVASVPPVLAQSTVVDPRGCANVEGDYSFRNFCTLPIM